jgi:hypothetical protein
MGKAKPSLRVDIEFEFTNVSNDYVKHYPDRRDQEHCQTMVKIRTPSRD